MNIRISLLSIVAMTISMLASAQTARNPLNHEPANVTLQKRLSSWKLSDEIFYRADGTPFDKRSFNYNEDGRITSEVLFRLNAGDNTWYETSKREYAFAGDKETVITTTTNSASRQNASKVETVYNTERKPLYSCTYSWNNDAADWSVYPYLRCEWEYNNKEQVIACRKQHINPKTNKWNDFDAHILYAYDEKGTLTEEIYQSWNPEQSSWVNKGRYTYSNNGEQQKTATSCIFVSDRWMTDGKTIYTYDTEGKLTRSDFYGNNPNNTPNAYSLCSYSENAKAPISVETSDIKVYPNPVISSFEITVPEEYFGKTMYLFDAFGIQVKSQIINNQTTQIDVSPLTSGIHILKIGNVSKTLIIK